MAQVIVMDEVASFFGGKTHSRFALSLFFELS
jgi:hypothetical protein